ncbi:unnamed protein product [Caenorhabditis auriculariae]|uniref:BTB domain-containing protein n=1 Tax=Caenorhabditis auriculariae TaxID=2777116 RepID=A0A8S1GZR5_9PELO|nr:unnamed protein product [Caenorhabditis auriculariae]
MSTQNTLGRLVAPGDKILDEIGEYSLGKGIFEANKKIFASTAGYVNIYGYRDKTDRLIQVVEVRRKENQADNELLPFVGAVVTAKVRAIGLRFAKCDILSVGDKVYKKRYAALLPKKKLKENEPELTEPFKNFVKPKDLILAKICEDSSIRDKFVLTIAEDQLGVVLCRGRFGENMEMIDWKFVRSTRTGKSEPRNHQAVHLGVEKKYNSDIAAAAKLASMRSRIDALRIVPLGELLCIRQLYPTKNSCYQDTPQERSTSGTPDRRSSDEEILGAERKCEIFIGDVPSNDSFVRINVGGQRFMLRKETILRRGVGRLVQLVNQEVDAHSEADAYFRSSNEYYFERAPALFHIIYQFYITGQIHQPSHLCPMDIVEELDYWQIVSEQYLAECCCADIAIKEENDVDEVVKPNLFKTLRFGNIRKQIWDIIEEPASSGKAQVFAALSVLFVLVSISGLVLGSLPELQVPLHSSENSTEIVEMEPLPIIGYVEYVCIVWFTFEYGMKMLVSAERQKTFMQLLNIIDLLAILPFIIEMMLLVFGVSTEQLRDLKGAFLVIRILRVLRVIRVLKLGRYSSGLQMFGKTLKASFRQLGMMAMVVMTGVIFFSTLVYFLEKDEPNSKFHSIPAACWWCIVTMTTVGYGDLTPITVPGKLVATGAIACGVLVLALPITIIVDNFMKVAEGERPHGGGPAPRVRTSGLYSSRETPQSEPLAPGTVAPC